MGNGPFKRIEPAKTKPGDKWEVGLHDGWPPQIVTVKTVDPPVVYYTNGEFDLTLDLGDPAYARQVDS